MSAPLSAAYSASFQERTWFDYLTAHRDEAHGDEQVETKWNVAALTGALEDVGSRHHERHAGDHRDAAALQLHCGRGSNTLLYRLRPAVCNIDRRFRDRTSEKQVIRERRRNI